MELQKFDSDLQELNFEEASEVNGGTSVWWYVGYAIGAVGSAIYDAATGDPIRPSTTR